VALLEDLATVGIKPIPQYSYKNFEWCELKMWKILKSIDGQMLIFRA